MSCFRTLKTNQRSERASRRQLASSPRPSSGSGSTPLSGRALTHFSSPRTTRARSHTARWYWAISHEYVAVVQVFPRVSFWANRHNRMLYMSASPALSWNLTSLYFFRFQRYRLVLNEQKRGIISNLRGVWRHPLICIYYARYKIVFGILCILRIKTHATGWFLGTAIRTYFWEITHCIFKLKYVMYNAFYLFKRPRNYKI